MIQQHHYCDECGKQMSYIDADGDVCLQGFTLSSSILDVDIRTTSGSSSSRHHLHGGEFCGFDCLNKRLAPAAYFASAKHDQFLKKD